jgi:hypothetical protein
MIFFVLSFYQEAKPLIEHFKLQKILSSKFEIFSNNQIFLILTREGIIRSSIGTTFLLTRFSAQEKDIAINLGICGAKNRNFQKGDIILCHKIINHYTKKAFYPDIIVNHDMKEGVLESFMIPVKKDIKEEIEGDIVDMEGAGFFESASFFLPPHNIHCIKIVYDFLDYEKIKKEEISNLIYHHIPKIENFIYSLLELNEYEKLPFEEENIKDMVEKLKDSLNLTFSMTHELEKYLKGYIIRKGNIPKEIFDFLNIKANSKKERKEYFERIKKLLSP